MTPQRPNKMFILIDFLYDVHDLLSENVLSLCTAVGSFQGAQLTSPLSCSSLTTFSSWYNYEALPQRFVQTEPHLTSPTSFPAPFLHLSYQRLPPSSHLTSKWKPLRPFFAALTNLEIFSITIYADKVTTPLLPETRRDNHGLVF